MGIGFKTTKNIFIQLVWHNISLQRKEITHLHEKAFFTTLLKLSSFVAIHFGCLAECCNNFLLQKLFVNYEISLDISVLGELVL